MSIDWYGNQSAAESCRYGPLAVIFPILQRMKFAEIVDRHLPADPQAEFPQSTVLSLLAAARLYSPMALVRVAEWAGESGADILWNIPVEKINDDRLGRSLDALFTQRHSILAELALHVAREFDVPLTELHYDPTHILFHGAYENSQSREGVVNGESVRSDDQLAAAHITKGRGTAEAPDGARMIHVGLCTVVDQFGPLPFFGHTVDGNQNGHTAVAEGLALMKKHLRPPELTLISDRGTFSVGHLMRLDSAGCHALCSAPWHEFRPLFDRTRSQLTWKKARYLSLEQQRRRESESKLPHEHYELAVCRHELADEESGKQIACRVIFVFSTADQKVVRQQRQKQIDKLRDGLEYLRASVAGGQRSTDPESIARRIAKLFGQKDAARYFSWEMRPLPAAKRASLTRPPRGRKTPTHELIFRFNDTARRQDEEYDGYSALVTTVPQSKASADQLFSKFKQQNYSEQINSRLKGPIAVSPVFLHTPERVESLVFLLVVTLMLYYLLQRLYRQNVPSRATQAEKRMTTRSILSAFQNYSLLIHYHRLGREIQPTRVTARQRAMLSRLGFPTPAQILSQRLPRAPT